MSRPKGCLFASVIALALIAILGALGYLSFSRQLDQTIQAIRDKGEPVTLAELDAWYPQIPESRNAAPGILRAYDKIVTAEPNAAVPFGASYEAGAQKIKIHESDQPDIAGHLAANAECLAKLAKASQLPECRYPYSLSGQYESKTAHLRAVIYLTKLVAAHSVYSSDTGDIKTALESSSRVFWLAETLRSDPISDCQRTRWDCHAIGTDAVNFALDKGGASEIDLASLQQIVLSCESKDTVYRELVADRARFADKLHADYATMELIDEYGQVALLDAASNLVSVCHLDRPKRRAEVEAIAHKLEFPSRTKRLFTLSTKRMSRVTPGWTMLTDIDDCDAALLRITATAIAVERFRLATGHLPQSLDELVPTYMHAIPEDPFDAKPLRLVSKGLDFCVYSIGRDRIDSGGSVERRRNKNIGDIAIWVMR